jgi:hypothetical protein
MGKKEIRCGLVNRHIHSHDVVELAAHILGKDPDDQDAVEAELYDQYGCDLIQFSDLIGALAPMALRGRSPLTNNAYAGFAVIETDGSAELLVKVEVNPKDQKNYKLRKTT